MRLISIFVSLMIAAAPASSESIDPSGLRDAICDKGLDLDDFVGTYTLQVGAGFMQGGGRTVAFKADNVSQVAMHRVGQELIMGEPPYEVILELAGEDEPNWNFDATHGNGISSDDLALVLGCKNKALPRLVGTGTSKSSEGAPIVFTYRLMAYGLSSKDGGPSMFGVLEWSGGGITQKRLVHLNP